MPFQVLPEVPSFGAQIGRGVGAGLGAGLSQAAQTAIHRYSQKKLMEQLLGSPTGKLGSPTGKSDMATQLSSGGSPANVDPFAQAKAAALLDQPHLARIFTEEGKQARKEAFARESQAEPKLQEKEEKLRNLNLQGMRFDRLEQLFQPELENKFPSSFKVGLLTKDGELRPAAAALLSPEAQESTKLIADELTGIKDSFGARVTNFDIQSYMKKLPTLLNSAEGRRRVLRDLKLMNQINRDEYEGVLGVIDRYGGPGNISISKAERIFKKEYAPKMKELREEFVNPDKKSFSQLPSAGMYAGRQLVDEETGQKFRSDGKDWIPE